MVPKFILKVQKIALGVLGGKNRSRSAWRRPKIGPGGAPQKCLKPNRDKNAPDREETKQMVAKREPGIAKYAIVFTLF